MTIHSIVPSDIEPDSILDLAEDCREVSGVLAPFVLDLTKIPAPRGSGQVAWSSAPSLEGYGEYGS